MLVIFAGFTCGLSSFQLVFSQVLTVIVPAVVFVIGILYLLRNAKLKPKHKIFKLAAGTVVLLLLAVILLFVTTLLFVDIGCPAVWEGKLN